MKSTTLLSQLSETNINNRVDFEIEVGQVLIKKTQIKRISILTVFFIAKSVFAYSYTIDH